MNSVPWKLWKLSVSSCVAESCLPDGCQPNITQPPVPCPHTDSHFSTERAIHLPGEQEARESHPRTWLIPLPGAGGRERHPPTSSTPRKKTPKKKQKHNSKKQKMKVSLPYCTSRSALSPYSYRVVSCSVFHSACFTHTL